MKKNAVEVGCAVKVKKTKVKAATKEEKTPSFIGREALRLLHIRKKVIDLVHPPPEPGEEEQSDKRAKTLACFDSFIAVYECLVTRMVVDTPTARVEKANTLRALAYILISSWTSAVGSAEVPLHFRIV